MWNTSLNIPLLTTVPVQYVNTNNSALPKIGNTSPHTIVNIPPLAQQPVVAAQQKTRNNSPPKRTYTQEQQKLGNQLHQYIKTKYPQYVAKLTGMILTMNENQIQNLLVNPSELDLQCEKLVQLLKTKQAEVIQNVVSGSDHNNHATLASSNNPMLNSNISNSTIPSVVPTLITPNTTLTGLHSVTSNFGGAGSNLMATYPHTFDVIPTFHTPLWPGNMSPGVGVVNNTNYNFVLNPNVHNTTNPTLPNSGS